MNDHLYMPKLGRTDCLRAEDVPPEPVVGVTVLSCPDHPDGGFTGGYGYAGGGFGNYRICNECSRIFAKTGRG